VAADLTLTMAKNAPNLLRLTPPEESPAGVARHGPIMQMCCSRTATHTAVGSKILLFVVRLRRHLYDPHHLATQDDKINHPAKLVTFCVQLNYDKNVSELRND